MPVSFDYFARETGSNLWRNRLMTIAAVLTVMVCLSLVGAALLLKQVAATASVDWERGTQVTVWMQPDASKTEIAAMGTQLKELSYVRACTYKDKQQNYDEAKRLLTADEIQVVKVSDMPTSYWCTPLQPQDANQVIARFTGQPGVRNVTAPLQAIHTEEEVINFFKWAFLIVALVLLVSATVLILNAIRMAIFARRREVSVMKLVGATNWFIRVPFMSEGLVQGLVGSLLAAGVVWVLHLLFNGLGNPNNPQALFTLMHTTTWDIIATDAVIVVIGVAIGSAGSAVAIRRFLDV
jgi:cell division transport system permease protein